MRPCRHVVERVEYVLEGAIRTDTVQCLGEQFGRPPKDLRIIHR